MNQVNVYLVKSFETLKIALLKLHTSIRSESSNLKLGRIRQQKSIKLSIQSIDSRISDLRTVKNAALYEMPQIASLNIHTSIRSESSKLMLGRIRQQRSVTLCIPSIDSRISDLRNVKYF